MLKASTFAFPHNGGPPEVLALPDIPVDRQVEMFRQLPRGRTHPKWARIEIWTDKEGVLRSHDFGVEIAQTKAAKPTKAANPFTESVRA